MPAAIRDHGWYCRRSMERKQTDGLGSLNIMAVAGFALAFMCTLAGLVVSVIALGQIKKSGGAQTGKGFALAGLAISFLKISVWVVLGVLALIHVKDISSMARQLGL